MNKFKQYLLLYVSLLFLWCLLFLSPIIRDNLNLDYYFIDSMYQLNYLLKEKNTVSDDVVILDLDYESLWLLDRPDKLADMVEAVANKGGAEVIGLDILFDQPKNPDPPEEQKHYKTPQCPYDPSIHPYEMKLACIIQEDAVSNVILGVHEKNNNDVSEIIYPAEFLKHAATGLGIFQVNVDRNGVARSVPLLIDDSKSSVIYTLGLTMVAYVKEAHPKIIDNNMIIFNNKRIKNSSYNKESFIVYPYLLGPHNKFKYINASELWTNLDDKNYLERHFKDSIVLVGSSSYETQDLKITPFTKFNPDSKLNGLMPGVEFQANIIYSLLHNRFYSLMPVVLNFIMIMVFLFIAMMAMIKLRTLYTILIIFGLMATNVVISAYLFLHLSTIVPSTGSTLITLLLSLPVIYTYKFLNEQIERKRAESERSEMMSIFDKYVSPDVASLIWEQRDKITLKGEKKVVTVMFTDIRGFTTLSENIDPEVLLKILNEYFEEMSKIIYENGGNLNKFIGDGLMILFGAPLTAETPEVDARNAINSGIKMVEAVNNLNQKWKNNYNAINIGVGIHTGEVIVGNVGSSKRLEYSALGDTVNLSSRLEGLNKEFKTNIIVSETTYVLLKNDFNFTSLGAKKVKGREKEVNIYTIDVHKEEINEN